MAAKVGLDCVFLRNTGTYGTPVWNPVTIIVDATLNIEKTEVPAVARLSSFEQVLAGLVKAPIDIVLLADTAIDDYDVLAAAAVSRSTVIDFAMADGAIATVGTRYWRGDYGVFGWSRGEPLEGAATINSALKLAYSTNVPAFTTVA